MAARDISKLYNDELAKLKTEAIGTPGNLAKEFVEKYIPNEFSKISYVVYDTDLNNDIENTKRAINVYKLNLSPLSIKPESESEDALITRYISVMANIAYLRVAMTIFILLQQKKITASSVSGQQAQSQCDVATSLVGKFSEKLKEVLTRSKGTRNTGDIYDTVKIEADAKTITDYITSLETKIADLSTLLSTSLPIISQFDPNSFVAKQV